MTDLSEQNKAQAAVPEPVAVGQSAGKLLSEARQAAGLEIEAVATALKVPVARVQALEASQWDSFPDAVFIRALATSMCRLLKLSPGSVLELLPQAERRTLKVDEGINSPLRRPGTAVVMGRSRLPQIPLTWAAGAVALAVGAGVLAWLLPAGGDISAWSSKPLPPEGQPMGAGTMVVSTPQSVAPLAPAPAASVVASAPIIVASSPTAPTTTAVVASATAPAVVASAATVVQLPASAMASAAAGGARVQFQTSAPSWVEVVDSKGATLLRKLTATGETVAVIGAPPLSVLVGRADVTRVEVRGKPMDLNAVARDNVARFEIK